MVSLQARSLGQALLRCHYVLFPVPPGLSFNRSLPVGPLSPETLVTFISGEGIQHQNNTDDLWFFSWVGTKP